MAAGLSQGRVLGAPAHNGEPIWGLSGDMQRGEHDWRRGKASAAIDGSGELRRRQHGEGQVRDGPKPNEDTYEDPWAEGKLTAGLFDLEEG